MDGRNSRLFGFLLYKYHNLLIVEIMLYRKQNANKIDGKDAKLKELVKELEKTLIEAATLLKDDVGCPDELLAISFENN